MNPDPPGDHAPGRQRPPASLRAMAPADLDAVMAIELQAYTYPWTRGNFADSLAAGHVAEVALDDAGHLAGYFVASLGAGEMHLLNLTVAPPRQGLGLGRWLLDAVVAEGRRRGQHTLWLEVRRSNQRALAVYRQRGFEEVGVRRGYYPAAGGREDAVVMCLRLVPWGTP